MIETDMGFLRYLEKCITLETLRKDTRPEVRKPDSWLGLSHSLVK